MIEAGIKLPELDERCKTLAIGHEVFHWPETVAFLTRLGVDLSKPYTRLVIDIPCDGLVTVLLAQRGSDTDAKH